MKRGAIIFAHNNRTVDYALMATISGGLAKKHLGIPVTLITDDTTIAWMKESKTIERAEKVFENIIEVEKPKSENYRNLHDGTEKLVVPFVNSNRSNAWELSPYDRTLLLDSDYFIFSNTLNEYWDIDEDVLISSAMNDVYDEKRKGYHDRYVSDTGIHMFWATTVMFSKTPRAKAFFDMVNFVRDNYQYYGDLFRFDTRQYRNDISFSVAKHIISGFETEIDPSLPPVLTTQDRDILEDVNKDGKLTFLVSPMLDEKFVASAIKGRDIHIMNKQSITRNAEKLLELI
jgi:hypothetical protein